MDGVWEVEFVSEFGEWWDELTVDEQASVTTIVDLLEVRGPHLGFPYSSGVVTSKHPEMRELRVQHRGHPYRILYAFDPSRTAILLLGGDKTGSDRWYEINVPIADRRFDSHLLALRDEGTG